MGFFSKIKEALIKTKETLGRKIFEAFKAKDLDDAFYEELEDALISSDVGVAASEQIIEDLKQAVYKKKILKTDKARDELKRIMLELIDYEVEEYKYPLIILIAGVNGVGKTTAVGKLAKLFKDGGKSVIVAAADTFRAAASEQLEIWAERAGVRIVKQGDGADPAAVVFDALTAAKAKNYDVVLVDTAGRLHNKKNLMNELSKINRVIDREMPSADRRNLIVLDATTGQNAVTQTEIFNEAIEIDGIILTKLDGTAKGGVVLAIAAEQEIPVVYCGVGEKIDDLIPFSATEFIDGIFSVE
ncbi:MAG: signal recognition particle-docking protein FtsY [Christensenellaceae bacterium]|jgi:fused signal recognition particle receptor|nr:signal recognition particle-docking protein FtsY [Christensenellaceae bacterium]